MTARVTGLQDVLSNLNREINNIEGDIHTGLVKAGIFIKAEAVNMTPVDYGVLRNSAFRQTQRHANGSALRVGFTAEYAPYVHEMPGTLRGQPRSHFGRTRNGVEFGGGSGTGNYWDGGEPKFLEKAVKNNYSEILQIIRRNAVI